MTAVLAVNTFSTDHFNSGVLSWGVIPEGINSQAQKMFSVPPSEQITFE